MQGALDKAIEKKSIEPAILSHILDVLSQGIAKNIVETAVKSLNQIDTTYANQGN